MEVFSCIYLSYQSHCSQYSEPVAFYTSGSVPNQPDPPMLSEQFVNALVISWIKRPNEDSFLLQMEDEITVSLLCLFVTSW